MDYSFYNKGIDAVEHEQPVTWPRYCGLCGDELDQGNVSGYCDICEEELEDVILGIHK